MEHTSQICMHEHDTCGGLAFCIIVFELYLFFKKFHSSFKMQFRRAWSLMHSNNFLHLVKCSFSDRLGTFVLCICRKVFIFQTMVTFVLCICRKVFIFQTMVTSVNKNYISCGILFTNFIRTSDLSTKAPFLENLIKEGINIFISVVKSSLVWTY